MHFICRTQKPGGILSINAEPREFSSPCQQKPFCDINSGVLFIKIAMFWADATRGSTPAKEREGSREALCMDRASFKELLKEHYIK